MSVHAHTLPSERACTLLSAITVQDTMSHSKECRIETQTGRPHLVDGAANQSASRVENQEPIPPKRSICTIGSETSTATRHRDANTPTARWSHRVMCSLLTKSHVDHNSCSGNGGAFLSKGIVKDIAVGSSTGAVDMLVVHVADVGREVLVHSERTNDRTVPYHVLLDSLHGAKGVRCASLLPVITVCPRIRQLTASVLAKWWRTPNSVIPDTRQTAPRDERIEASVYCSQVCQLFQLERMLTLHETFLDRFDSGQSVPCQ